MNTRDTILTILAAVSDVSGTDIIATILDQTRGRWFHWWMMLTVGNDFYATVWQLEDEGLVAGRWEDAIPSRRLYSLTTAGLAVARQRAAARRAAAAAA